MTDEVTAHAGRGGRRLPGRRRVATGPGRDGRGGGRRDRRTAATWWSRPAPAPASPSPTWSPPSSPASGWWWPPPPRPSRTSWPPRTCPWWPRPSTGDFSFAVLKGRSNYLCRQRVAEIGGRRRAARPCRPASADPPDADDPLRPAARTPDGPGATGRLGDQVRRLVRWADDTATGDRAELDFEPHFRAWAMVSTTARECPGRLPVPVGPRLLRRGGPGPGRRRPTWWWSTPTSTAPTWPAAGAVLPPARRGRLRRGPRGRGRHDRQPRASRSGPGASGPWPPRPGRCSTRGVRSAASPTASPRWPTGSSGCSAAGRSAHPRRQRRCGPDPSPAGRAAVRRPSRAARLELGPGGAPGSRPVPTGAPALGRVP